VLTDAGRRHIETAFLVLPPIALICAMVGDAPIGWRASAAAVFFLVSPGLAVLAPARFRWELELAMLLPTSLAMTTLVSLALFYAGVWTPTLAVVCRVRGRCPERCGALPSAWHTRARAHQLAGADEARLGGRDMTGTVLATAQHGASAYERILGWSSVAPVLLLIALLIELELLRAQSSRSMTRAAPTLMVLVAPLSVLVVAIGLARALKLVT
jgi:hypothetical protein